MSLFKKKYLYSFTEKSGLINRTAYNLKFDIQEKCKVQIQI